ncbi:MAG: glycosyltransferase [Candidatus Rokubacteria bacterium]|nr:glycosyltransferase [Candidatus Rokubacteria bacterium]
MRVLLGPLNPLDHRQVVGDLGGLDVRCFDRHHAEVLWRPGEPFGVLWERLAAGWTPDLLIWWSPEYSCLPEGLEECPVPSLAVLGDWNLGLWATAPFLEAFDAIVTDRKGVATLGPQLETPVDYWPVFSFDPGIHRRLPGAPKEWDICFVGNFNHDVQADRAGWLLRLARLSPRRRVLLATGIYGEAYARLLNTSRVVFNRSIRGELNMRAYEATACGALLFMEAENLEVADVFAPGEACVLYTETTLEPLLDHYLEHPDALERVAEAGWRRVQSETYRHHLERLLTGLPKKLDGPRPFRQLPPWRRAYWAALKALCSPDPAGFGIARAHFERALRLEAPAGPIAAGLGALFTTLALDLPSAERIPYLATAERLLAMALEHDRRDAITLLTFGRVKLEHGDPRGAESEWLKARAILESGCPFAVDRFPVPFPFDRFRVEWERAAVEADPDARAERLRPLLLARVSAGLARLAAQADELPGALTYWADSVNAAPGLEQNLAQLGHGLEAFGEDAVALEAYGKALEWNPFDFEARARAMAVTRHLGDAQTEASLAHDGRAIVTAAPYYRALSPLFDRVETESAGRVSA